MVSFSLFASSLHKVRQSGEKLLNVFLTGDVLGVLA